MAGPIVNAFSPLPWQSGQVLECPWQGQLSLSRSVRWGLPQLGQVYVMHITSFLSKITNIILLLLIHVNDFITKSANVFDAEFFVWLDENVWVMHET